MEAAHRANHTRALAGFLRSIAREAPQLIGLAYTELGVRALRVGELVQWLLGKSEKWQRHYLAPYGACLGYHGGPHVCNVPGLDPTAASTAAGSWKRAADHRARLA